MYERGQVCSTDHDAGQQIQLAIHQWSAIHLPSFCLHLQTRIFQSVIFLRHLTCGPIEGGSANEMVLLSWFNVGNYLLQMPLVAR